MKTSKKFISTLVLTLLLVMAFGSTTTAYAVYCCRMGGCDCMSKSFDSNGVCTSCGHKKSFHFDASGTGSGSSGEGSGGHVHDWKPTGRVTTATTDNHEFEATCSCGQTKWFKEVHSGRPATQEEMPLTEMFEGIFTDTPLYNGVDANICSRAYKCDKCGAIYFQKLAHLFAAESGWQQYDLEKHHTTRMCVNCNAIYEVKSSEHNFSETWTGGTEGHQLFEVCKDCEQPVVRGDLVPHNYSEPKVETTAGGIKTTTKVCKDCGYENITREYVSVSNNPQEATVVSPVLTEEEIRTAAGAEATTSDWRAIVGSGSTFNTAKSFEQGAVWGYAGDTYTLSKRADGMYYVCRVPGYYWDRIDSYNPNANNSPGSGTTSTSSYTTSTKPPEGLGKSNWNSGLYSSDGSNGGYGSQYMQQVQEAFKATFGGTLVVGPVDTSKPRDNYAPAAKPAASSGVSFTTIKDPDSYTGPKIKIYNTNGGGSYSYIAGTVASDGSIVPAVSKTVKVQVHHCSWSTSYQQIAGNNQSHTVIRRSCCGGHSTSTSSHGYRAWTYTDLGPGLHRAERKCAQCGYVDTKIEAHYDNNNDTKCDACTRLLWTEITWRWYDEHTPVQETSKQYYYQGLITPVARGRQDYKFTGWWTEWGGVGIEWCDGDDYPYGSPKELFASWQAIVDVDFDVSGPIITVVREPADASQPSKNVVLTITAVDPDGNDHELPIQVNSEDEWHESPYNYVVTNNDPVVIVARDTEGNTREFVVYITNMDTQPPTITEIIPSSTGWTKDPIKLTVYATDDVELDTQPYRWEFTANEPEAEPVVEAWTSSNVFTVNRAGKVRVEVRDAVGNTTWSDPFYVNNVDTIAPSILGYELSANGNQLHDGEKVAKNTGVTISLTLQDTTDPVTGMSSGLAATPIQWIEIDGHYTTKREVTVYKNGTYNVQIKDAAGNESNPLPITISHISGTDPVINGITMTDANGNTIDLSNPSLGDKAPITVAIDADFGEAGKPDKPYSYDGGITWTSVPWFTANDNGEYTVMIKDANGTTATQSFVLGNVDNTDPLVTMTLFKGVPDDWTERFGDKECTEEDWVWKLSVVAKDPAEGVGEGVFQGSGIKDVYCQWNGQTITPGANGEATLVFDVKEPASYQVTVTDNAGHQIQAEKVVQWTDLSESVYGPNPNVTIGAPDIKPDSTAKEWEHGSAGAPFNANLEDLVFGPTGAYNTNTGVFTPYPAGMEGIPVNFNGAITRNKWATAVVSFNNKTYPVKWMHTDVTGEPVETKTYEGTTDGKVLGSGDPIPGYTMIPLADVKGDVKNGRIRVTVREWNDEACTDLNKEGTENFYTSVQNSKPTITYTYNRGTDEMTVVATSSMAGIDKVTYAVDGGSAHDYTGPFQLGDPAPSKITLTVTDKLGVSTTMEIDVANLGLLGNTAGTPGTDTLPEDAINSGISASHSSNRAADIYIIGGTRGNTDVVPAAQVFANLFG